MTLIRKGFKGLLYLLIAPIMYVVVALLLTSITVNDGNIAKTKNTEVFLNTNGVHLDIIIPIESIDQALLKDLKFTSNDYYLSFGWGDENFYLNTPTWSDLTFKNAVNAMFFTSNTLIHLTRYGDKRSAWVKVKLSNTKLSKLNDYIINSFKMDSNGSKVILDGK